MIEKNEFCRAAGCCNLKDDGTCFYKGKAAFVCNRTAKEFYRWLKANGYRIFKAESDDVPRLMDKI